MLQLYTRLNFGDKLEETVASMKHNGIPLSPNCYRSLIEYDPFHLIKTFWKFIVCDSDRIRWNQLEDVKKLFNDFRSEGTNTDIQIILSNVIRYYIYKGHMDDLNSVLFSVDSTLDRGLT
jgi:hypothetical protein